MKIKTGYKELVARAEEDIETLSPEQALESLEDGDSVFIDVRDIRELKREGKIPGAWHVPRGMLEFWIDPESPYHKSLFTEAKRFIFYCNLGWRSALATQTAQMMGLENVCHIRGGFDGWIKAGGQIEELKK